MDIKEFIKDKASEDQLPFKLTFEVEPNFDDYPKVNVAGYELPKIKELLSRELWWFQVLGEELENKRKDLQIALAKLADDFRTEINQNLEEQGIENKIEYINDALYLLESSLPPDCEDPKDKESKNRAKFFNWLLNSQIYQEFLANHFQAFHDIIQLEKSISNERTLNWLKVTFMMLSRYSGNWDMSDTAALPESKINSILQYIESEMNNGQKPETEENNQSNQNEENLGN